MFIFNIKMNKNILFKLIIGILIILSLIVLCASIYKIFINANSTITVNDSINIPEIANITTQNYTNILNLVYNNLDTYIGQKISFCGYVYRVYDLESNQFVLARDMVVNSNTQTLVVGFLCKCDKANEFENGTWVEISGKITKGDYHGEIPLIDIDSIKIINKPDDVFVYPPDSSYIPTSFLF